jgi:hypothetical protein
MHWDAQVVYSITDSDLYAFIKSKTEVIKCKVLFCYRTKVLWNNRYDERDLHAFLSLSLHGSVLSALRDAAERRANPFSLLENGVG